MRRVTLITVALAALAAAGIAQATNGTATVSLSPNKAGAATAASVSVTGLTTPSGIPSSLEVTLQKGFTTSLKAVSVLCTAAQGAANTCPAASRVGTGSITVSGAAVPVNVFLGSPVQSGDKSSVILVGSFAGFTLHATGRVFVPPAGGLELLVDTSQLPQLPVTISGVNLTVHGSTTGTKTVTVTKTVTKVVGKGTHRHRIKVRKKVKKTVKVVYAVLTNPATCNGTWTGSISLNYSSGAITVPLSSPCTQ